MYPGTQVKVVYEYWGTQVRVVTRYWGTQVRVKTVNSIIAPPSASQFEPTAMNIVPTDTQTTVKSERPPHTSSCMA